MVSEKEWRNKALTVTTPSGSVGLMVDMDAKLDDVNFHNTGEGIYIKCGNVLSVPFNVIVGIKM